ncbi:anti-sigma factor domain-containing protein [Jeotgalibacillus aurantiacus]|uniref:anti-sigma factor domain-containing protein n=1 Tax=Jeotgalibacillus aurantiacus TaxID=2763266 RepID=UPI001D0B7D07|nr:anti-sigma factor domain-containing protein [Jeotgalibacillus aurantiacus]
MKKGLVMEIHKRHVVLMTRNGEFCKVAKPSGSLSIGEEVVSYPLERRIPGGLSSIGAMAAVAMIMFFLVNPYFNEETYAHIAVDINPSFELMINEKAEVIQWTSVNEDAEKLENQLNLNGESIQEAMSEIIAVSGEAGFINENNETVTISAVYTNESSTNFQKVLRERLDEWSVQENKVNNTASISIQEGAVSDLAAAKNQGISFGKLITQKKNVLTMMPLKEQPILPPLEKTEVDKILTETHEKDVTEASGIHGPDHSEQNGQPEESAENKDHLPSAASHGQNMKEQKQERNEERKEDKQKDDPEKAATPVKTESESDHNKNKENHHSGNANKSPDNKDNKNKGPGNNNGNGKKEKDEEHPGNGNKKDKNE